MTARIPATTETTVPDATRPILARLRQTVGMVPNIYATIGHSPGSLTSVLTWSDAIGKGTLTGREIELLNLHLSELNGCAYCVSAHTALAARAGITPTEAEGARDGLGATPREQAILALARRVLRTGGARAGSEIARAREAGLTDAELIDVLAVVALNTFRNAVNLVAETEIDFPPAPRLPAP